LFHNIFHHVKCILDKLNEKVPLEYVP
jgi:hypothetical protein